MKIEVRLVDIDGESVIIVETSKRISPSRAFRIAERAMSDLVNEPFTLPHSG